MPKSFVHGPIQRPALLVSVRNADEALLALAGGADIIDVKEPTRGSLGAADADVIGRVLDVVGARVPISIAAGELPINRPAVWTDLPPSIVNRVTFVKWGLAGCGDRTNWTGVWREVTSRFSQVALTVAVVYADWHAAAAPPPNEIVDEAKSVGCAAVLVDTWDKTGRGLFDNWSMDVARTFCRRVQSTGLMVALAGSLCESRLADAVGAGADIVALRGAACIGGRTGCVSEDRIRAIRASLRLAARSRQDVQGAFQHRATAAAGEDRIFSRSATTLAALEAKRLPEFP
jgi:(5-formylfuran-3-yl)methyl phosphate synthase